jgi:hypothetical protein
MLLIHENLDVGKEIRRSLDFIEDDGLPELSQKTPWVLEREGALIGQLQ